MSTEAGTRTKTVVLFSGGIDSTLCIAKLLEAGAGDEVLALTVAYGQRNELEIANADKITKWFGIADPNVVLLDSRIFEGSRSALIPGGLELDWSAYRPRDRAVEGEVTSAVPFRNGIFASIATAYALSQNARYVVIGTTGEGASQYADCSPEFISAIGNAIFAGTDQHVGLLHPLSKLSKLEIVEQAIEMWRAGKLPLQLTRSCYDNYVHACGRCLACQERLSAFNKLGVKDPAIYVRWA